MKTCPSNVFLLTQAVHVEMEQALHDKDELKLRVHSYITEVSRIEKLMATKVKEVWSYTSFGYSLADADPQNFTPRSRRTGTCWNASGWPTPSPRSGSRSCSRLKASTTPSAWSCCLRTQSEGSSARPSVTTSERSSRYDPTGDSQEPCKNGTLE